MYWRDHGRILRAIDYYNPDSTHDEEHLRHVELAGMQVVQITPEEVLGPGMFADAEGQNAPAALFDLGKDEWFQRFTPRHLERCSHYQLMFYEELIDVICENVICRKGSYMPHAR